MKRKREQGYGRQFWQDHVTKLKTSGKSQFAYAAENGIRHQTLSGWVNKIARERLDADNGPRRGRPPKPSDDTFAKVVVKQAAKMPPISAVTSMRMLFPGGIILDLLPGFDVDAVAKLIAAGGGRL